MAISIICRATVG